MKENGCKKKEEAEMVEEAPKEAVLVVDDDGNECKDSEMKDGKCPGDAEVKDEVKPVDTAKENAAAVDATKPKTLSVEVKIPDEFVEKMNAIVKENAALKEQIGTLASTVEEFTVKQNAEKEEKDFTSFKMRLNQAAQDDAKTHYTGFREQGWAYFDAHPEIMKGNSVETKLMGAPAVEGNDPRSDRQAALRKLHMDLGRKR